MMAKVSVHLSLIGFLLLVPFGLCAQEELDRSALGFSGSYGNRSIWGSEVNWNKRISMFNRTFELKAGLNYRSYALDVHGVSDLQARAVGVFGDLNYYPLQRKGLYVGLRIEPLSVNVIRESSRIKYEAETGELFAYVYSGSGYFLQVGHRFRLGKNVRLRLSGLPGIQQYQITPLGPVERKGIDGSDVIERYYRFIYQINAGVEFKLR